MPRNKKAPALSPLALELKQRLASSQGQQAQHLNIQLGQELARAQDPRRVAAMVELLADPGARSDAIKVLYEGGYVEPSMLVPHAAVFFDLLGDRRNRMVWGGMIALIGVAKAAPEIVWERRDELIAVAEGGTVITQESAFRALVAVAASAPDRLAALTPWIVRVIEEGRDKDLVRRATLALPVLDSEAQAQVVSTLACRAAELGSKSMRTKAERLVRKYG